MDDGPSEIASSTTAVGNDDMATPTFPRNKIKAALQLEHPDIGILRQPVIDFVSACSAQFLKQLVQSAASKRRNDNNGTQRIIALADLQQEVSKFSWLHGVLEGLEEGVHGVSSSTAASINGSSKPRKKRAKTKASVEHGVVSNSDVAEALRMAHQPGAQGSEKVVPDEDDYD
jgi:hypothetical protein